MHHAAGPSAKKSAFLEGLGRQSGPLAPPRRRFLSWPPALAFPDPAASPWEQFPTGTGVPSRAPPSVWQWDLVSGPQRQRSQGHGHGSFRR